MNKEQFLTKYNIAEADFEKAEIAWEQLERIAAAYIPMEEELRELGKDFIDTYLYDIERAGIHSYRYRIKEPGHLLEKIIANGKIIRKNWLMWTKPTSINT